MILLVHVKSSVFSLLYHISFFQVGEHIFDNLECHTIQHSWTVFLPRRIPSAALLLYLAISSQRCTAKDTLH